MNSLPTVLSSDTRVLVARGRGEAQRKVDEAADWDHRTTMGAAGTPAGIRPFREALPLAILGALNEANLSAATLVTAWQEPWVEAEATALRKVWAKVQSRLDAAAIPVQDLSHTARRQT